MLVALFDSGIRGSPKRAGPPALSGGAVGNMDCLGRVERSGFRAQGGAGAWRRRGLVVAGTLEGESTVVVQSVCSCDSRDALNSQVKRGKSLTLDSRHARKLKLQ